MKVPAFILIATSLCSAQIEPKAGQWKTWVIPNGSALRLPAPPAADATAAELQQVKQSIVDQATLDAIRFWDAGSPGYRWMQTAVQAVVSAGLPTPMQTRALALVAAAISDGMVAAWDSKYTYNRKHPSDLDSSIVSLVAVPQDPSYPSEHAVAAGAAATVLGYLIPTQAATFTNMATQAASSRVAAGVAFPSDASAGLDLGRSVAQAVIALAKMDGSDQQFTGSYPPAPGVWGSSTPVAPLAGTWRPWVLNGAGDLRPVPPPAFRSGSAVHRFLSARARCVGQFDSGRASCGNLEALGAERRGRSAPGAPAGIPIWISSSPVLIRPRQVCGAVRLRSRLLREPGGPGC